MDILKVIGWCDGRMGGWRFVKGLGSMNCYGLSRNQVSEHSRDKAIDSMHFGCGLVDGRCSGVA